MKTLVIMGLLLLLHGVVHADYLVTQYYGVSRNSRKESVVEKRTWVTAEKPMIFRGSVNIKFRTLDGKLVVVSQPYTIEER